MGKIAASMYAMLTQLKLYMFICNHSLLQANYNGTLCWKLFWPTVRKKYSDRYFFSIIQGWRAKNLYNFRLPRHVTKSENLGWREVRQRAATNGGPFWSAKIWGGGTPPCPPPFGTCLLPINNVFEQWKVRTIIEI